MRKIFLILTAIICGIIAPVSLIAQPERSVNDSTAPYAHDLFIQGVLISGYTVTGSYLYTSPAGIPEGNSRYRWYTADSIGAVWVPVDSAATVNYTIDSLDIGKYLVFEVTPVAISGDSLGEPATVYSSWSVGGVGINETSQIAFKVYPNPAAERVFIESSENIVEITLCGMDGKIISRAGAAYSGRSQFRLDDLDNGLYLLVVRTEDGRTAARTLVHQ
jgi:hypothetical protein